ncbi:MAG: MAPEG family protein [Candidatus Binatus sp.]|uniref:MAPEG family protein n=1 Tax=Candidatus Binatus sp. TaxID=2811406 RepID=UPI002724BFBC|nr:MAPEG family protein [Candidatus Binatus sp.]MDO8431091.1 MAPEG family protein [Candidatus Binatus sp.]
MTLLRMYAITAIVLALKMSAISVAQGRARVAAGIFVNPEDARLFQANQAPEEAPAVQRAARAWLNDLENIPIFLILCWIYVAAGLSPTAFVVYCVVFMVARIAHTICYLNSIQPLRTIVFTVGALDTLALMVHLVIEIVLA